MAANVPQSRPSNRPNPVMNYAAMTFALGLGSGGNVRTTTLKAFTKEQFAEIVKKLP
jgi:uncharacterized protein with GYD domain